VVHKYSKKGFEVEFVTAEGKTIAVLTLQETDIRSLQGGESCMQGRYRVLPTLDGPCSSVVKLEQGSAP